MSASLENPMRRSLVIVLLVLGCVPAFAEPRPLTIEEAVRSALERNADVLGAEAELAAARARRSGAGLLLPTNPSVTVTTGPRSSPSGRTTDHSVQVSQQIEIAGQRGLRIAATQAGVDAAQARVQAVRVDTAARVRESFARALAAGHHLQLATETVELARQGVEAAEERFAAGAAALIEVNTARIELGRAGRERAGAQRRRAEVGAELRLLAGIEPADEVALQGELAASELPSAIEASVEQALATRGEVLAARRAVDAARADLRLASREWIPSPRVGASYTREQESDTNIVQSIVSIDLPVFNRNKAARGVAAARVTQLEAALTATERAVRQDVATAAARLDAARGAAEGYAAGVVKAMQENMELATESHREGKLDFLQLLVIRRQTIDARREYIEVLAELAAARAQLDRAIGRLP